MSVRLATFNVENLFSRYRFRSNVTPSLDGFTRNDLAFDIYNDDEKRITAKAIRTVDADVICLQEVARFMPDLDQGAADDQIMVLARLFPDYEPIFGTAINLAGQGAGQRRQFGNLILSRLPVIQSFA